jgi:hypothetical protein
MTHDEDMREEYDFSKGERGKFFRPNARTSIAVYLDAEVLGAFDEIAQRKGIEVSELINDVLKRDLANAEALR